MKLEVIGHGGQVVASAQGPPPVVIKIPNAPPGTYKARMTALILDHGPETPSVTFASNAPCTSNQAPGGAVAPGTPVRVTISDSDLNQVLAQAGAGVVGSASVHIQPSTGGAIVTGSVSTSGLTFSGTALIYAAPPGLGATIASASLNGITVTSQAAAQLAQISGHTLDSLHTGFTVDRVYSCKGPQGGMLVVEGHGES